MSALIRTGPGARFIILFGVTVFWLGVVVGGMAAAAGGVA